MSAIDHLLRWRKAHPEEWQRLRLEGLRRSTKTGRRNNGDVKRLIKWRLEHPVEWRRNCARAQLKRHGWMQVLHSNPEYKRKAQLTKSKNPLFQMGEHHVNSKVWLLRSPERVEFEVRNLSNFVRNHLGMFNPDDVILRDKYGDCRAVKGLGSLHPMRKKPKLSWKGWTWATTYALATKPSHDILQPRYEP